MLIFSVLFQKINEQEFLLLEVDGTKVEGKDGKTIITLEMLGELEKHSGWLELQDSLPKGSAEVPL